MKNRLDLNWQLNSTEERVEFVNNYVSLPQFLSKPLTPDELDTIGNYILWAKDKEGFSVEEEGYVELPRRNSTWAKTHEDESLDALLETPTFNEQLISPMDGPRYTAKKETFDRQQALNTCPSYLIPTFTSLFHQIDVYELMLNYYDLKTGKRQTPPREELVARLGADAMKLQEKANHLTPFKYLKLRHLLVELRREQFSIRDSYTSKITRETMAVPTEPNFLTMNAEIPVFPLGTIGQHKICEKIFVQENQFKLDFTPHELIVLSSYYWEKKNEYSARPSFYIDFRDLEHVYQLFLEYFSLRESTYNKSLNSEELIKVLQTLEFYIDFADLTDVQRDILRLKMTHHKNQDIAIEINAKYNKSYTTNYISTIFRQKIIPKINEAAVYHEKRTAAIFFKEEFKPCSKCGTLFLKDERNFVHKSRSKDGFAGTCKRCDKLYRENKK